MNQKIYVGNLPYEVTSEDLNEMFSSYGAISDVKLIIDHATGKSKGFGFITFEEAGSAEDALQHNGNEINGRSIKVSPANDGGGRSGGGGRRFGGGGQRRGGGGHGHGGGYRGGNRDGGGHGGGHRGGNY